MLTFDEAREKVAHELSQIVAASPREKESVALGEALRRILAEEIRADRPYPSFDRSIRDGFAVRASDVTPGAKLKCVGELKAGDIPEISLAPGTCIQIMTGAAVPAGADAVVMIEHTHAEGDSINFDRTIEAG